MNKKTHSTTGIGMDRTRVIMALACVLLLAGCAGNLARLKTENPQAEDFESALAAEYLAYADSEHEMGHKDTADYFAGKGLAALEDEAPAPETSDQKDLAEARAALTSVLTEDIKRVAPQKAARAQILFDCWQHQESTHANDLVAPCAEEFHSGLEELQEIAESFVHDHTSEGKAEE